MVSHLRLSRVDYWVISQLCHPLSFKRYRLRALRRLLVGALAPLSPELSQRVAELSVVELRLLHDQLRAERHHGLSPEEVRLVARVGGPLLVTARFRRPLRRTLVRHFRGEHPELATKLERLSDRQFERLCEQVPSGS
jgi:hypothetical protein